MPLLFGCKVRTRESGETHLVLDLSKVAPIGYEICADRPPRFSAANLDLQLQMPQRIAIPPDQQNFGAKSIEFRMGRHDIDLYQDLHSGRLLHAKGDIAMEVGVPTLRVKLELTKLPKGRYVLGVSGDPFFAYCTVDLQ